MNLQTNQLQLGGHVLEGMMHNLASPLRILFELVGFATPLSLMITKGLEAEKSAVSDGDIKL